MPFDYADNIQAVLNCLTDHNTTTASPDLSASVTTRVVTISDEDPKVTSLRSDDYPAIFVNYRTADEDFGELGQTGPTRGRKFKEVNFDLFVLNKREGQVSRNNSLKREMYNLARNVEGVFQAELTLSGTALWCNAQATDFVGPVQGENGVMVHGVLIALRARYHFR